LQKQCTDFPQKYPRIKQPAPIVEPETDDTVAENVTQNETIETAAEETAQPEAEEPVQAALPKAEAPKAVTEMPPQVQPEEEEPLNWTARLVRGLDKSRNHMAKSLAGVFGGGKIDEDLYEELETVLLTSDMGIEATEHLMKEVRERVSLRGLKDGKELRQALKEAIYDLLKPLEKPLILPENGQPFVIMMAGINGAGKTTSIGKLAKYFQKQGKSVMLAAGDTFRAAAREQLQEWGERNGVVVISQEKGDSAAVCFDAVEAAKARKIDVVLADTAGRLPTQRSMQAKLNRNEIVRYTNQDNTQDMRKGEPPCRLQFADEWSLGGYTPNYAVFRHDTWEFACGTHGNGNTELFVLKRGAAHPQPVKLDDILLPNQKAKLANLLKAAYVKYLTERDSDSEQEASEQKTLEYVNGQFGNGFQITNDWRFDKNGLTFEYDIGELGAYAEGGPKLTIPVKDLQGIIKPETLREAASYQGQSAPDKSQPHNR